MYTSIPDIKTAQQVANAAEKVYYFDRAKIWFTERLTANETKQLRYANRSGLRINNERMAWQPVWKQSLEISQPTDKFLKKLNDICEHKNYIVNYIEIAVDLMIKPERLDDFHAFLAQHAIYPTNRGNLPKNPRQRQMTVVGELKDRSDGTIYLGSRKCARTGVIYSNRASKITHKACTHWEWRIKQPSNIKKIGIDKIKDLITFNFGKFFAANCVIGDLDDSEFSNFYSKKNPSPRIKAIVKTGYTMENLRVRHKELKEKGHLKVIYGERLFS